MHRSNKRRSARLHTSSEAGSIYVEAALTIPVVLALLFGVIEYGNILTNKAIVSDTARRTARIMAAQRTPLNITEMEAYQLEGETLIKDELEFYDIPRQDVNVSLVPAYQDVNGHEKEYLNLSVTVTLPCKACSKFAGLNFNLFTINANSRVLMEQQPPAS